MGLSSGAHSPRPSQPERDHRSPEHGQVSLPFQIVVIFSVGHHLRVSPSARRPSRSKRTACSSMTIPFSLIRGSSKLSGWRLAPPPASPGPAARPLPGRIHLYRCVPGDQIIHIASTRHPADSSTGLVAIADRVLMHHSPRRSRFASERPGPFQNVPTRLRWHETGMNVRKPTTQSRLDPSVQTRAGARTPEFF